MFFRRRRIYLDYASATPVLPEALSALEQASGVNGNPGAIHSEGVRAARLLQESREKIALELACKAREIVFVSGGTEANNLAILGFLRKLELKGIDISKTHWITSAIEHPSVLECFSEVERRGGLVSHVNPDGRGIIAAETVGKALRKETVFVSIQWANHEIGTIQPIRDIRAAIKAHEEKSGTSVIFHSDFGQAPLYLSPQVHSLGVDIASLDSGKLYGPRGIGCVYLNNRAELARVIFGGGQERGLRAGTENVALAAGFAEAFSMIGKERERESKRVREMRGELARELASAVPSMVINGDLKHSLPHILNVSVPNVSSEYVTLQFDRAGIAISTKSACREGEESRSHVVEALAAASEALAKEAGNNWRAQNTLRFSLGRDTSATDIKNVSQMFEKSLAMIKR
ncbi:cysteine desulfurase [Candidatus Kaiserbacteria bacterium]|nr:cysteine desulfurase [Candidatus Kaiserbacteria bacterium]